MENNLSNLVKISEKKKKRVGRGLASRKGAKSGRGTTRHQKARESIPLHFEGGQGRLVKKYPLLRGKGRNKSFVKKPVVVKLKELNLFSEGQIVDLKILIDKKIVDKRTLKVKILANGDLKKKLIVKVPASVQAKKKIEALGGKVEIE